MKTMDALKIAGIVAAGVAAYWAVTKVAKVGVGGAAKAVTAAAGEALSGGVKGIGETVGIPDTDLAQCRADLAAGKMWDASFSCPLPVYAKAVKDKILGGEAVNPSNVNAQASVALPDTGAGGGQSSPAFAATDPRRLDLPSYSNPFADVVTQDFNAMGDFPLDFSK